MPSGHARGGARACLCLIARALTLALAGLALAQGARAQSPTASARYDLGPTWVAICQAPCLVRTLGSAPALVAVAASPPTGDDPPATVLTFAAESGLPITVGTAYARALSTVTRVVVMPYAPGGGSGAGDASAANQQLEISSLGADGTSPPTIAGTGIRGWLRAIYERLTGTLAVAWPSGSQTTSGALQPPTAASGKAPAWFAALSAATSTQLLPANPNRIAYSIQCTGSAAVAVSETGATLTTATPSAGSNVSLVIPAGASPYFTPIIASLTAITGYTGTAQACWGSEYLR